MATIKNTERKNIYGTSFHNGVIKASFNELVAAFGDNYFDDGPYKVSAQWSLEFEESGICFSIYDWKEYDNYPVDNPDDVYEWHIGTKDERLTHVVVNTLKKLGFRARVSQKRMF